MIFFIFCLLFCFSHLKGIYMISFHRLFCYNFFFFIFFFRYSLFSFTIHFDQQFYIILFFFSFCPFQTLNRRRPTFGGYTTKQEMCLSFITYYPKIELAGCYSMTPVKEFFEIFGVYEFYSLNMTDVENLFLYNG